MSLMDIVSAIADRPAVPFMGAFLVAWLLDVFRNWCRRA